MRFGVFLRQGRELYCGRRVQLGNGAKVGRICLVLASMVLFGEVGLENVLENVLCLAILLGDLVIEPLELVSESFVVWSQLDGGNEVNASLVGVVEFQVGLGASEERFDVVRVVGENFRGDGDGFGPPREFNVNGRHIQVAAHHYRLYLLCLFCRRVHQALNVQFSVVVRRQSLLVLSLREQLISSVFLCLGLLYLAWNWIKMVSIPI